MIGRRFGNINLLTKLPNLESREGTFEFCYHGQKSNQKFIVDIFNWVCIIKMNGLIQLMGSKKTNY